MSARWKAGKKSVNSALRHAGTALAAIAVVDVLPTVQVAVKTGDMDFGELGGAIAKAALAGVFRWLQRWGSSHVEN